MPETRTLQEIILAVHFADPLNVTVKEIAALAAFFESDYPFFQQAPAAPRVELFAPQVATPFAFAQTDQSPRILLRSNNQDRVIQFQSDRFCLGWTKTTPLEEAAEYPGYAVLRGDWIAILKKFEEWRSHTLGGTAEGRLIELAYHNAAPLEVDGKARRLSDILRFVQSQGRQLIQFGLNWAEVIGEGPEDPRVQAQAGMALVGPGIPAMAYSFTGLAPISGPINSEQSLSALDTLHQRIIDMHASAIISQ